MQTKTFVILLAATAFASVGCASAMQGASQAAGDPNEYFMVTAAQVNLAEIEAGQLAAERARSPEVREYAQTMVQAHWRAHQELMEMARQKGVALPDRPDEARLQLTAHLAELPPEQFDREYMSAMTADHAKALSMFQDKSKLATDPEVRAWAERTVPGLRHHLEMATSLNERLGGASTVAAGPEPGEPPRRR